MTLPIGKYPARALNVKLETTEGGNDKAPQEVVLVGFEVTAGEHKGAKMQWRGWFTEKSAKRTIESLVHCGWEGNWDTFDGVGSLDVTIDVQEDKDLKTGEIRGTRIAWVNPPLSTKPLEGQAKNAFTASMRGIVAEVLGSKTSGAHRVAPAASPRAPAPPNGQRRAAPTYEEQHGADAADDIPFVSRGAW